MLLHGLAADVRDAWRGLVRAPRFTAACAGTLALGLGASTAVFGVVDGILLKPLPFANPDRLVHVANSIPAAQVAAFPLSPPEYARYRSLTGLFEGLAVYTLVDLTLAGDPAPERVRGAMVSAGFFDVLGVGAVAGRGFAPGEDEPGAEAAVVIGGGLWARLFARAPDVVGRRIRLDDRPRTIVGVMPDWLRFPPDVDLWIPVELGPADFGPDHLGRQSLRAVGRLAGDGALASAQAGLDGQAAIFHREHGAFYDEGLPWKVTLTPLAEHVAGATRRPLAAVFAAALFVLSIAWASVANLLLARETDRATERAVRAALGASAWRLRRRTLAEAGVLALAGGGGGALVAWAGVALMARLAPPAVPRVASVGVDARTLAFALAAALVSAAVVSLAPAMRPSIAGLSRGAPRGVTSTGRGARRARAALVAAEIAFVVPLAVGVGLLARSFATLARVDPGFDARRTVTARIATGPPALRAPAVRARLVEAVLDDLRARPGVAAAGATSALPLGGRDGRSSFTAEGADPDGARAAVHYRYVTPGYFETMRIPIVRGRSLEASDTADAPRVVLVNQAFARQVWPGRDPVGRRLDFGGPPYTVVGVAGDVRHAALDAAPAIEAYLPLSQPGPNPPLEMTLVARGAGSGAPPLAAAVASVDPTVPVYDARPLERVVWDSLGPRRFALAVVSAFALFALALAAVGAFSNAAYAARRRTRELGVRLALGASAARVRRDLVGEGLFAVAIGLASGLGLALALGRFVAGFLFGVSPLDARTLAVVAIGTLGIGTLALWRASRRVLSLDPVEALRHP